MREPTRVTLLYGKPFHGSPEYIPNPLPGTQAVVSHQRMLSQTYSKPLAGDTPRPLLIWYPLPGVPFPSSSVVNESITASMRHFHFFPVPLGGMYLFFLSSPLRSISFLSFYQACFSTVTSLGVASGRLGPTFILVQHKGGSGGPGRSPQDS